ncbi:MAG: bifunctional UDP-3-O-[3-hydroxymyristoyl] N-acetylglucosamine deacetylase/3-hydroxyacyl-ACP dehydratase [Bacteroidota bacterium]|nr:bifunctional UDP-3-O-[3-hydroxymyristoyl] N-acetylglucosamine deacetylase/3-hydroxyacyl-ACP dehydratase [Bacteroidota bacterium]
MNSKQYTLKTEFTASGSGLHTNSEVSITVKPAEENHGYIFQRIDLEGKPLIHALAENVIEASRSTIIAENKVSVATIEHLMSALYASDVDNALIEIDGPEVPIMDGSAKYFIDSIEKTGITEQNAERNYYTITEKLSYTDAEKGIEINAYPDDDTSYTVLIDYNSKVLGNQYAQIKDFKNYKTEIAGCKTFVFLRELEVLLSNNQIKGGDLKNALVIVEKETTQKKLDELADLFNKPRKQYKGPGFLNNQDLSFPNEPARHKLLDLIGDFALAGARIKGRISANRPGHYANTEFIKSIRKEIKKSQRKNFAPNIDVNAKPLYDIMQIREILPHRPPFLLVDKIMTLTEKEVVGVKNVTMNEPFFVGHFPGEPVMPGVLIIEAMAQTGGILVLNTVPDPENYLTYFLKINNVRFKNKVVPGDTLVFKLILLSDIRRGLANMQAYAFVGDKIVAEGELLAQIAKDPNK